MDRIIGQFIGKLEREKADLAVDNMKFPKSAPFDHGVQVGTYQGVQKALEILQDLLAHDEEQEAKS